MMTDKMNDLRETAKSFALKLKKIKVLAFDVDGVLTTGLIWYSGDEMGWNRSFNTRDGYMMQEMRRQGFLIGIITGGNSRCVHERFDKNPQFKVDFLFCGDEDKRHAYDKIKQKGFKDEEILYMGDEFFDMPVLKQCGFSATVPEASIEIKEIVDYVTETSGGRGAVREVLDLFRYANNIVPKVPGM